MSRTRLAPRTILVSTFLLLAGTAWACADDAGSGADAGNAREAALAIPYGSHAGALAAPDSDWYVVTAPASSPRCLEVEATSAGAATGRLTAVSPDRERATQASLGSSGTLLALPVPALTQAYFDVAGPLGAYGFTFTETGVPPASAGDALLGADAGNDRAHAAPAPTGCFGGRVSTLGSLPDLRDVYSLQVPAGQEVTYGIATTGAPTDVTLTLLAADGTAAGPSLVSGQRASVAVPTAGTYYLNVVRSTVGTDDTGYVVSVVIGPPEPNGCRPYC